MMREGTIARSVPSAQPQMVAKKMNFWKSRGGALAEIRTCSGSIVDYRLVPWPSQVASARKNIVIDIEFNNGMIEGMHLFSCWFHPNLIYRPCNRGKEVEDFEKTMNSTSKDYGKSLGRTWKWLEYCSTHSNCTIWDGSRSPTRFLNIGNGVVRLQLRGYSLPRQRGT